MAKRDREIATKYEGEISGSRWGVIKNGYLPPPLPFSAFIIWVTVVLNWE
jgi:hypothetical protein